MKISTLEKIFGFSILFLVSILWYHQIIKGDYFYQLSEHNRIKTIALMPDRGDILDRVGRKIATQRPRFDLAILLPDLKNKEITFKQLNNLLGISLDELETRYRKKIYPHFSPLVLVKDIPLEKVFMIEEKRPQLEGVEIQVNSLRVYPFATVAANLIGYLGEVNLRELERLKPYGYRMKSLVGKSGLEKSLDIYLKGEFGGRLIEVDNRLNLIRILGEREPSSGKDIQLTIDMEWQKKTQELIKNYKAAVLIMDVRDGQILVLESSPSFDPNLFISGDSSEVKRILNSPKSVLLNRAVKANFAPGSLFKLVTAIAGLETKKIKSSTQYRCEGRLYSGREEFRCWQNEGHGYQSVVDAIKYSCNIFFYKLGLALGPQDLKSFAQILGLSEKSGIELKEETKGFIPTPAWKKFVRHEKWFEGDTLNFSIGQGFVLVSPIQILRLVACIANGGFLVRPYLVKSIAGISTREIKRDYTGISQETLNIVKEGMFKVVNDPEGTGRRARVNGLTIAAKTATVETGSGKTHAWISGFLPYSNPKLAFVIFLEHGGRGGVEAAQIAQELLAQLKDQILDYP